VTTTRVPQETLRRIVELATRAPSVHNTQPWRWRATPHSLELYADRSRQLSVGDPAGRNLVISCGVALHHARIAADALGFSATITRFPDPERPDLLARLDLAPATSSRHAAELLDAIDKRYTDRRRFTSWPVPDDRLTHLAARATAEGARALPLTDVSERFHAELLINRAIDLQHADALVMLEQQSWIDHSPGDGVPSQVLPLPGDLRTRRPSRFATGLIDDMGGGEVEGPDGLIVFCAPNDDPGAWLTAGEGLSSTWLTATMEGLSVVPISQVIEVEETRAGLQLEVLGGLARPLVVIRVGWQAISRSQLARTPRRPVAEVLELA
jgi:nitroreductase family protein